MSLKRTASGIANIHLFFRVDIVVYCEGGEPKTAKELIVGDGNGETLDVLFWQKIFSLSASKLKFHFKSVGSKAVLIEVAEDIDTRKISSVRVCLDRDHDHHFYQEKKYKCVFYTYGYSWENDVLSRNVIRALFWRLNPKSEAAEALLEETILHIDSFEAIAAPFCEHDIALIKRKGRSMFSRKKPLSSLDLRKSIPSLRVEYLKKRLTDLGYKRGPRPVVRILKKDVGRHMYGHLLAGYFFHLFRGAHKIPLNFDNFIRLCISEFESELRLGRMGSVGAYFLAMVRERLPAAK